MRRHVYRSHWRRIAYGAAVACLLSASPAAAELLGHGGAVKGVDVSPDGRRVVTASFDYTLVLWDLERQAELISFDEHEGAVNAVAI
ncbi:MAG: hypothetical protein V3R30_08980, partial [Kiloniellales bacterium]